MEGFLSKFIAGDDWRMKAWWKLIEIQLESFRSILKNVEAETLLSLSTIISRNSTENTNKHEWTFLRLSFDIRVEVEHAPNAWWKILNSLAYQSPIGKFIMKGGLDLIFSRITSP